jgi:hypothetical protein
VVPPRPGRDRRAAHADQRDGEQPLTPRSGTGGHAEGDAGDRRRRDQPQRLHDLLGQPGAQQQAVQRLVVGRRGVGVHAAGVAERAVQPVGDRLLPEHEHADGDGRHEGADGNCCRPQLPGDQEVGDEEQRRQLDARGDADPDAHGPPAGTAEQVPEHERHEEQVHLAQEDGGVHRLGGQQQPGRPARQQEGGPPSGAGGPPADDGAAQEQHYVDDGDHRRGAGGGQPGQRREEDRGERRVGEGHGAPHRPAVERAAVQHRLTAGPVDLQVDGVGPQRRHGEREPRQAEQCRGREDDAAGGHRAER